MIPGDVLSELLVLAAIISGLFVLMLALLFALAGLRSKDRHDAGMVGGASGSDWFGSSDGGGGDGGGGGGGD
jgi:hypothetical protein